MGSRAAVRRLEVARRDGWRCHYCERRLGFTTATEDHVVPRAWAGGTYLRNSVLACRGCNERRGSELVVCGCPFCVAARLHWWNHAAPRWAREAVVSAALDLRGSTFPRWLSEAV